MRILAYQSCDISRGSLSFQLGRNRKQRIQLSNESILSTHQLHQSRNIMRNKPSPLPCSSFTIIIITVIGRTGIERGTPFTFTIQSAHETGGRIKIKFVRIRKTGIFLLGFSISQAVCQHGNTPVIVCIFQRFRNRFILTITRDIAKGILIVTSLRHYIRNQPTGSDNAGRIIFRRTQTCLVSFLHIKIAISLHIRIGYQRSRMIPYHRSGIIGYTIPFRENTTFLMLLYQWTDKFRIQLRIDNSQ